MDDIPYGADCLPLGLECLPWETVPAVRMEKKGILSSPCCGWGTPGKHIILRSWCERLEQMTHTGRQPCPSLLGLCGLISPSFSTTLAKSRRRPGELLSSQYALLLPPSKMGQAPLPSNHSSSSTILSLGTSFLWDFLCDSQEGMRDTDPWS